MLIFVTTNFYKILWTVKLNFYRTPFVTRSSSTTFLPSSVSTVAFFYELIKIYVFAYKSLSKFYIKLKSLYYFLF